MFCRRSTGLIVCLAIAPWLAGSARAETLLRWKFTPGATLHYEFRQATRTETTGAGKPTTLVLDMAMYMTWTVDRAAPQGPATISQTIDKLTMTMQVDDLAPVVYDSAARPPTSGPAKEIADSVGSLIGGKCQITMSDRGEIVSVEPGEELRQVGEKSKAGNLFTADGLTRILRQASIVLPEKPVPPAAKWETVQQLPSPLGELQLDNHYVYEGPAEHDGREREKVTATTAIAVNQPQNAAAQPATLKEGSQSGILWFDVDAGRFVQSQFEQRLVSERPYREMTIRVRSTSNLEMKLVDR